MIEIEENEFITDVLYYPLTRSPPRANTIEGVKIMTNLNKYKVGKYRERKPKEAENELAVP